MSTVAEPTTEPPKTPAALASVLDRAREIEQCYVDAYRQLVVSIARDENQLDPDAVIEACHLAGRLVEDLHGDVERIHERVEMCDRLADADRIDSTDLLAAKQAHRKAEQELDTAERRAEEILGEAQAAQVKALNRLRELAAKSRELRGDATRALIESSDSAIGETIKAKNREKSGLEQDLLRAMAGIPRCQKLTEEVEQYRLQFKRWRKMPGAALRSDASGQVHLPAWLGGGVAAHGDLPQATKANVRAAEARIKELEANADVPAAEQRVSDVRQQIAAVEAEIADLQRSQWQPENLDWNRQAEVA